ncbi:MAG TPA: hypothetical protein VK588_13720, partial [Chitinophagaceae bacterium]|nr:hypothetical protein [Chitinophagaceae bacterium]
MKTLLPCAVYFQKNIYLLLFFSLSLFFASAQNIDFGKSFVNITKGNNGGSIEPGDVLEIRASIVVRAGTYDSCGYFDSVPAGTSFIPGSIRVLTNEGKIYKQFTDVAGDDCGWIASPNIRINMGYVTAAAPATAFRRGRITNTNKPSFFGGTCIMVASFRVVVTAAYNNFINIGGGSMTYKTGGVLQTFTFPGNTIMVYQNFGICSNTVGVNSIGTEFNGTFGSGKPRNRGTSANVPPGYTYSIFTSNMPNDYYYGIANNTSTNTAYTTLNTWAKPDLSPLTHRVFKFWDIIGDHTGAVSPTLGNPAADTVANPNAGYMLVINAAYRIDSAFQQTITGLCPNTYYEISCWLRNICSKCGCDSNGVGAGNPGYIPTALNDSSGVAPNLTMSVDNLSYYTTGNIPYTQTWVKKGFTVLTGPVQTSFTVKFFNNAPGGGGNDWALDDISIATCSPDLTLLPSANPMICAGNIVNISCLVKSFFNNYTYYKWQKSIDNGATWANDGPTGGPATPTWMGADWEYTVVHPTFIANMPDSGSKYRLVLATTLANLTNPGCSFSQSTVITLKVINCGPALSTDLISFTAKRQDDHVQLNWTTTKEESLLHFSIEKSWDAKSFNSIATINSYNNSQNLNFYSYPDRDTSKNIVYYRLKITDDKNRDKYSRTIELNENDNQVTLANLVNPFDQNIKFDMIV